MEQGKEKEGLVIVTADSSIASSSNSLDDINGCLQGAAFHCSNKESLDKLTSFTLDVLGIDPNQVNVLTEKPFVPPGGQITTGLMDTGRQVFISAPGLSVNSYKSRSWEHEGKVIPVVVDVEKKTIRDPEDNENSSPFRLEVLQSEAIRIVLGALNGPAGAEVSKLIRTPMPASSSAINKRATGFKKPISSGKTLISVEKIYFTCNMRTPFADSSSLNRTLKDQAVLQQTANINYSPKNKKFVRIGYREKTNKTPACLIIGGAAQKEVAVLKATSVPGQNELGLSILYIYQRGQARALFKELIKKNNQPYLNSIAAGLFYSLINKMERTALFNSILKSLTEKDVQNFSAETIKSKGKVLSKADWLKRTLRGIVNHVELATGVEEAQSVTEERKTRNLLPADQQVVIVKEITKLLPFLPQGLLDTSFWLKAEQMSQRVINYQTKLLAPLGENPALRDSQVIKKFSGQVAGLTKSLGDFLDDFANSTPSALWERFASLINPNFSPNAPVQLVIFAEVLAKAYENIEAKVTAIYNAELEIYNEEIERLGRPGTPAFEKERIQQLEKPVPFWVIELDAAWKLRSKKEDSSVFKALHAELDNYFKDNSLPPSDKWAKVFSKSNAPLAADFPAFYTLKIYVQQYNKKREENSSRSPSPNP